MNTSISGDLFAQCMHTGIPGYEYFSAETLGLTVAIDFVSLGRAHRPQSGSDNTKLFNFTELGHSMGNAFG